MSVATQQTRSPGTTPHGRAPSKPGPASPTLVKHREPWWYLDQKAFDAYMKDHGNRERKHGDYGDDNFAYDPDVLDDCEVPPIVVKHNTPELAKIADDWILAEAAILTSLLRIRALRNDAWNRLDPDTTHGRMFNRRGSNGSSITSGAESVTPGLSTATTAPTTMPVTPFSPPFDKLRLQENPLASPVPIIPVNMVGLESPRHTPLELLKGITPASGPFIHPKSTQLDTDRLVGAIQNLPPQATPSVLGSALGAFTHNQIAWEHYLELMDEELYDFRKNALPRLRSYGDRLKYVLTSMRFAGQLSRDDYHDFESWYKDRFGMFTEMARTLEETVQQTLVEVGGDASCRKFIVTPA